MNTNTLTINKTLELGEVLNSVTLQEHNKKCLYINKDQKAVKRIKPLYSWGELIGTESNVYFEIEDNYISLYVDFGFICYDVRVSAHMYDSIEDIETRKPKVFRVTYEDLKVNFISIATEGNAFFNVSEIELLRTAGEHEEYIQLLINSRNRFLKVREEKERMEREQKEEQRRLFLAEQKQIVDDAILKAEQIILNKQELVNDMAQVYKNEYSYDNKSIVNLLFQKHNIDIPLKVKGWISKVLIGTEYVDGNLVYTYDNKKGSQSTTFFKYYNLLVEAIEQSHKTEA